MNGNSDVMQECEYLIFTTYAQAKDHINHEFGSVRSFISNPIEIVDEDEGLKFERMWKVVGGFQSGKIHYQRR